MSTSKHILTCLFVSFSFCCYAQHAIVKGTIKDTTAKNNLQYAVAALFSHKDSLLVTSTRSFGDGEFVLDNLKAGSYWLLVTYPSMADFIVDLNLKDTGTTNIGNIVMASRYHLLQEVTVTSGRAIRMKGDTLEYKADSFFVKPNASVEELLKRLPGIEVSRDGSIKAQGEKVTLILVDGDEFFGDDPTLATRYLQASGVDKIQVFDKKSEQSTFTGIDDGKHTKTINIKLKENSKQGYFGQLSGGSNANNFYNADGMFSQFKQKQKITVFSRISNTGTNSFSAMNKFRTSFGDVLSIGDDDESMMYNMSGDDGDFDYSSSGGGLPTNTNAGVQFADKLHKNKHKINGSYRFNKSSSKGFGTNNYTQVLPDGSIRQSISNSNNYSNKNENQLKAAYDIRIDSFASIAITINGNQSSNAGNGSSANDTRDGKDGSFINQSIQNAFTNGTDKKYGSNISWKQQFRKKGRTLSVTLQHSYSDYDRMLQTESANLLYDPITNIPTIETPEQQQRNKGNTVVFAASVVYTEKLSKFFNLEASYAAKITNSAKNRNTFSKNIDGKYEQLIDSLSNNYTYNINSHIPGLLLNYSKKKVTISIGGKLGLTGLEQSGIASSLTSRHFVNLFPQTNMSIQLKQSSSIHLSYSGRTQQPSLEQLQPLKDKSNPLSELIGNPNLKPSFSHDISLSFNTFSLTTFNSFNGYAGYNATQNSIVYSTIYDQFNKSKSQFINTNGNYNAYVYFMCDRYFRKLGLNIGLSINGNLSSYASILNSIKNISNNKSVGIRTKIKYEKQSKYSITINPSLNYSQSKSSIGTLEQNAIWSFNHTINLSVFLPWKLELETDANMDFQPYNPIFKSSNQVIKWNASLNKKITKNEKLEIRLAIYDILNQNTGYYRYTSGNSISESSSNYIPRYAMLSLNWNFTHTHK